MNSQVKENNARAKDVAARSQGKLHFPSDGKWRPRVVCDSLFSGPHGVTFTVFGNRMEEHNSREAG